MAPTRVALMYDKYVGDHYYQEGHPMKPQRIHMTNQLLLAYDLYKRLELYRISPAAASDLAEFHDADYIEFLRCVSMENLKEYGPQSKRFAVGEHTDCPVFEGLWEMQRSLTGGSVGAANLLMQGACDIAINWAGGLHHAKKAEASGFCYINDIVLAILSMLKQYERVLYIDIDVHHGDGVEEAFYTTPRVMTVSFHKFGDFFPGTGDLTDVGEGEGQYYSLNVPLDEGLTDEQFDTLFDRVISRVVEVYKPGAIVLQCGADSLAGDKLGRFNLTLRGHGGAVLRCKKFGLPLLMLGGGGYTVRNVARCWAYETACALGVQEELTGFVGNDIPWNLYSACYAQDDHKLHISPRKDLVNRNSDATLHKLLELCDEHVKALEAAPGVEFSYLPPVDWMPATVHKEET